MNTKAVIPDIKECYDLMNNYGVLQHIIDHSVQVMRVSLAIADDLVDSVSVNRDLLAASALLHDISKTRTIQTGEHRHDLIGGEILRKLGWDSVALIVESHVVFENFSPDGDIEEREIVFYADKRVMHDNIVTIDERVNDLLIRYGKTERIRQMILENKKFINDLEKKISNFMKNHIDHVIKNI